MSEEKMDDTAPPQRHILAVDDCKVVRAYLSTILPHLFPGVSVETCSNGTEALKYLATHPDVQLILSDIMMPVLDGALFVRCLASSEHTANIPVVLLTSLTDKRLHELLESTNVVGYIQKPVNPRQLREKLAPLLSVQNSGQPRNQVTANR
jgi:CheY-like chemotaxis protein